MEGMVAYTHSLLGTSNSLVHLVPSWLWGSRTGTTGSGHIAESLGICVSSSKVFESRKSLLLSL